MRAVSLFTGAGGMDLGFERAGFETVLQCDLFDASHLTDDEVGGDKPDEKRRELTRYGQDVLGVLERHWPATERVNDVRNVSADRVLRGADHQPDEPQQPAAGRSVADALEARAPHVDLLHFGSPCQDLSVAGRRDGFVEGGRSHLFFEGVRVARECRAGVVVWENVVGALSSNGGRDFAAVLASLADAGAVDIAWRVLDARWFGVPQRRRRVFVVADFGAERASAVLLEPEGGAGSAAPRGASREEVACASAAGALGTSHGVDNLAHAVSASAGHHGHSSPRGDGADNLVAPTLGAANLTQKYYGHNDETVDAGLYDVTPAGVRRLTPRECERLMGWPDDHTRWTADGREVSDSHRYRMCGNGVVAPVAEWLGRRLMAVVESEAAG
ncbi:MAG: DNA cytosine methyltransferase [Dehalococcoidia bacterium]|nr:DNA cytosine methyltransferase [Dehalococcoidia bacterium]